MDTDQLVNLVKESEKKVQQSLSGIKRKEDFELVLLLGPTGSGKTTLFYGIMNKQLNVIDKNYSTVLEPEERINEFIVGHNLEAETTIPNLYYDSINNVMYCDCPGFFDTRGDYQDIANCFSIDQLLNCSNKIKIIFIISIFDIIAGKGKNLVEGSFILEQMFSKETDIYDSVCLVITHCDSDLNLDKIFQNQFGTNEPQIIDFFRNNINNHVFLFPTPSLSSSNIYNDFHDRNKIVEFILNSKSIQKHSHKIILSTSAKEMILTSAACFGSIPDILNQFIKNIKEEYLIQGVDLIQWKNKIQQMKNININNSSEFSIKVSQIIPNDNKYKQIYEQMDNITPWIQFVHRVSSSFGMTRESTMKNPQLNCLCLNINEHFKQLLNTCEVDIDNMIEIKTRQEEQRRREIEASRLAEQQRIIRWEIEWRKFFPYWQKPIPPVPSDWYNEYQNKKCLLDVLGNLLNSNQIDFLTYFFLSSRVKGMAL